MDDHRFDSLTKSLATGASRRSVFKGLLGLGGAATVGSALKAEGVDAARRPAPTPKPPSCPGQQIPGPGGECNCPATAPDKCGPDCCNSAELGAAHSECCDQACCFGHCYGEELCCPYPRTWCEATGECCPIDLPYCCGIDGCCATPCCETTEGLACCTGDTPKCCPNDICVPAGTCCAKADCPGCQDCIDHVYADSDAYCPGGINGCLECIDGACQQNSANCDDGNSCTSNTCNADGSCSYGAPDCRIQGCGCVVDDVCRSATCNQGTGACDEAFDCSAGGCCTPPNMCFQSFCHPDGDLCVESFFCTNDELTEQEADACCEEFGNPDPACLYVSGAACTTVCPSGLGFVQADNGCCFKVFCDCCTAYDAAGIVDFADCLRSCVFSTD